MNNLFEVKQAIPFELKDLDEGKRMVKFGFSAYNVIDSDKDVLRKGAFTKSFNERGADSSSNRKIQHLRYHDFHHQIGALKEFSETNDHAIIVSKLGTSTKGEDAFRDYQDGIIREHSYGYKYIDDKITEVKAKDSEFGEDYFNVTEVNVFEVSAVTFGANEFTPVFDVSKGLNIDYLERLNKEYNALLVALANGKGTNERLYSIEMSLKVCQSKYNSLIEQLKPSKDTLIEHVKSKQSIKFFQSLLKV